MSIDAPRSRRAFLATVPLVVLAGCLGDDGDDFEYTPAPNAEFEITGDNADGIEITQTDGDTFDGTLAALEGSAAHAATPSHLASALGEDEWSPGTTASIAPFSIQRGELEIVWRGDEEPTTLATYEVT